MILIRKYTISRLEVMCRIGPLVACLSIQIAQRISLLVPLLHYDPGGLHQPRYEVLLQMGVLLFDNHLSL